MTNEFDITVIISTYNRCEMLGAALECALEQESRGARFEVIVADNNSTDKTREVVESYIARGWTNLRYVFEPRQGVSYTRNAGIASARAEIIAFADDDVRVSKDWVANIKREFDDHREVDCIGGKVLPRWKNGRPRWLTPDHWMPMALQDYGDERLRINAENRLCLVSANLAIRRAVFAETGLFEPELQRVGNGIGSMEDAELLERFWRAGRQCLYTPALIAESDMPVDRMTKSYHRRWHTGHGYFFSIMRSEEMERSSNRLFDVPAHLYRQALADAAGWLKRMLMGKRDSAFFYETRLRFFWGFFQKRRQDYLSATRRSALGEILAFIRAMASRKDYPDMPKASG